MGSETTESEDGREYPTDDNYSEWGYEQLLAKYHTVCARAMDQWITNDTPLAECDHADDAREIFLELAHKEETYYSEPPEH